ncbi:hypothetical protein IE81DRAFT_365762 [Ceraceosorus guamensis]|uniref:Uncharacterized protein n=1 Tax=Ceraceosorus guamensis TaxID=1522189 RepID=A0A316W1E0_9BASI|nr:hypothetical protein IE81DRAFT_365762 [Ceraceosorus guamensis]PWN43542.1 hypothetical protein IE81DRAFT_365762 [Ceraceosorus guamensis]
MTHIRRAVHAHAEASHRAQASNVGRQCSVEGIYGYPSPPDSGRSGSRAASPDDHSKHALGPETKLSATFADVATQLNNEETVFNPPRRHTASPQIVEEDDDNPLDGPTELGGRRIKVAWNPNFRTFVFRGQRVTYPTPQMDDSDDEEIVPRLLFPEGCGKTTKRVRRSRSGNHRGVQCARASPPCCEEGTSAPLSPREARAALSPPQEKYAPVSPPSPEKYAPFSPPATNASTRAFSYEYEDGDVMVEHPLANAYDQPSANFQASDAGLEWDETIREECGHKAHCAERKSLKPRPNLFAAEIAAAAASRSTSAQHQGTGATGPHARLHRMMEAWSDDDDEDESQPFPFGVLEAPNQEPNKDTSSRTAKRKADWDSSDEEESRRVTRWTREDASRAPVTADQQRWRPEEVLAPQRKRLQEQTRTHR